MDHWIKRFREAVPVHNEQKVLIPGDPEREMEIERKLNGIPLLDPVFEDLQKIGEKFKINL
jgi:LDH2 family malate/lactate/ureidoglycolate dehydrogenase